MTEDDGVTAADIDEAEQLAVAHLHQRRGEGKASCPDRRTLRRIPGVHIVSQSLLTISVKYT